MWHAWYGFSTRPPIREHPGKFIQQIRESVAILTYPMAASPTVALIYQCAIRERDEVIAAGMAKMLHLCAPSDGQAGERIARNRHTATPTNPSARPPISGAVIFGRIV